MPVMITLNKIRYNHPDGLPCKYGWEKLLKAQGKTEADDVQFPITDVLTHNGLNDANWCIDCLDGHDREKYHYMAEIAEMVLHLFEGKYPDDMRPRLAIQAKRDYADGKISKEDMNAAMAAALAAARAAAWAAAGDSASAVACAAKVAAAIAAAGPTVVAAAWAADRQNQEDLFRKWFG